MCWMGLVENVFGFLTPSADYNRPTYPYDGIIPNGPL